MIIGVKNINRVNLKLSQTLTAGEDDMAKYTTTLNFTEGEEKDITLSSVTSVPYSAVARTSEGYPLEIRRIYYTAGQWHAVIYSVDVQTNVTLLIYY